LTFAPGGAQTAANVPSSRPLAENLLARCADAYRLAGQRPQRPCHGGARELAGRARRTVASCTSSISLSPLQATPLCLLRSGRGWKPPHRTSLNTSACVSSHGLTLSSVSFSAYAALSSGSRCLTYGELAAASTRTAALLQREGPRRGDRIAVTAADGIGIAVLLYAASRLGRRLLRAARTGARRASGKRAAGLRPKLLVSDDPDAGRTAAGHDVRFPARRARPDRPRCSHRRAVHRRVGEGAEWLPDSGNTGARKLPITSRRVPDFGERRNSWWMGTHARSPRPVRSCACTVEPPQVVPPRLGDLMTPSKAGIGCPSLVGGNPAWSDRRQPCGVPARHARAGGR
jgi:hypothetical protein